MKLSDITEAAQLMPPAEAMRILGIKPGEVLTMDDLNKRYRPLAVKFHPNSPGGDHSMMVRVNTAKDSLVRFVGRPMPSPAGPKTAPPKPSASPKPKPEPDDGYWNSVARDLPPDTLKRMWPGQKFESRLSKALGIV